MAMRCLKQEVGAKVVLVHDKLKINGDLYAWDDVRGQRDLLLGKRDTDKTKRSERIIPTKSKESDSSSRSFETQRK